MCTREAYPPFLMIMALLLIQVILVDLLFKLTHLLLLKRMHTHHPQLQLFREYRLK